MTDVLKKVKRFVLSTPGSTLMVGIFFSVVVLFGDELKNLNLSFKRSPFKKAVETASDQPLSPQTQRSDAGQSGNVVQVPTMEPVEVSVDDDPVLGVSGAPITIIEFSDYECPYCKTSFQNVVSKLKTDYINAGKVKLVFRDLPLTIHANAHKEAQAAECAGDQGGDETYFKFHDELFNRTKSGGTGISLELLLVIAKDLGLDQEVFNSCLSLEKYKDEVDRDAEDSKKYWVDVTPYWFIGKSSPDGKFEGTPIAGAADYSLFKKVIDGML